MKQTNHIFPFFHLTGNISKNPETGKASEKQKQLDELDAEGSTKTFKPSNPYLPRQVSASSVFANMPLIRRASQNGTKNPPTQSIDTHRNHGFRFRRNSAPSLFNKLEPFDKARRNSRVAIITSDDAPFADTDALTAAFLDTMRLDEKNNTEKESKETISDKSISKLNDPSSPLRTNQEYNTQDSIPTLSSSTNTTNSCWSERNGHMSLNTSTSENQQNRENREYVVIDLQIQEQMESIRKSLATDVVTLTKPNATALVQHASNSTLSSPKKTSFGTHSRSSSSENYSIDILDLYQYNNSSNVNLSVANHSEISTTNKPSAVSSIPGSIVSSPTRIDAALDQFEMLNGYPENSNYKTESMPIDPLCSSFSNNIKHDNKDILGATKDQSIPLPDMWFNQSLLRRNNTISEAEYNHARKSVNLEFSPDFLVGFFFFFFLAWNI